MENTTDMNIAENGGAEDRPGSGDTSGGGGGSRVDDIEAIELRLKPQHPTFTFSDPAADVGRKTHAVYTEKTLDSDVIRAEYERERQIDQEIREKQRQREDEEEEKEEEEEEEGKARGRGPGPEDKDKSTGSIHNIDVQSLLLNLSSLRSLSEISGTESMAILSYFVDELIWISASIQNGSLSDKQVGEVVFGDTLWRSILSHDSTASSTTEEDCRNGNASDILQPVLQQIMAKKDRLLMQKKMELISKSQEELGVSIRKSSKILSNFETDATPRVQESDLVQYVEEEIGRYEKCLANEETLQWLSRKFYLKSAPKMELGKYIDRLNSNLGISGATGLCAGWFLFKFVFNLKCQDHLSSERRPDSGGDALRLAWDGRDQSNWASRSFPLVLGDSFAEDAGLGAEDGLDAARVSAASTQDPAAQPGVQHSGITVASVSKLNAFRLVLTCVRLSSKLIEDKNYKQHFYCKVAGLQKLEDLFRLELALGYGLDWELFTNEYTLWRYLFHMRAFVIGCRDLRRRVDGSDASASPATLHPPAPLGAPHNGGNPAHIL